MLFYVVGELFQEAAVNKAKRSIEALLKVQVEEVTVLENGNAIIKHPSEVQVGQTIQTKPGEKIALDGVLISDDAVLNTATLTGESLPVKKSEDIIMENKEVADQRNMVFASTILTKGRGKAIVCATGKNTVLNDV